MIHLLQVQSFQIIAKQHLSLHASSLGINTTSPDRFRETLLHLSLKIVLWMKACQVLIYCHHINQLMFKRLSNLGRQLIS
jgi:hypothetical protein